MRPTKNPLRACLVTKQWRHGTGWFAQLLTAALAEAGVNVSFVSPEAEPRQREPASPRIIRYKIHRELTEGNRWRRALNSLLRSMQSCFRVILLRLRMRLFLFSIPEPLIFTIPLFLFLRLSGAEVFYIVHDARPHAWRLKGFLRPLESLTQQLAYNLASRLIVLTQSTGVDLCKAYNVPATKIHVIPHGIFPLERSSAVPGSRKLLLFGTIRRNKSVMEAIRGIREVRDSGLDVQLVIAGEPHPDERDYWNECLAAIEESDDGFEVLEAFIADSDLPALIDDIDAFLLSYCDDFHSQSGVGVLAGAARRPIIATSAGGLSELFNRDIAGVLIDKPLTSTNIAKAVSEFYQVPLEVWRRRADQASVDLNAALSWQAIGEQYTDLLRSGRSNN
jgi:glycogen synthase